MGYRYETHMHTCQGSACGRSTGAEHARYYKDMGYQGIIVTDHFFGGNTAAPRTLSWRERIEWFCSGYEDALAEGQKIGLDVFFGWEQCFERDEYLVYGLDKAWLLAHPEMEHWTREEQLREVRRYGGCVIQAHPFRERDYIFRLLLCPHHVDGIEVANAGNEPEHDGAAARYAQAYGLFAIAGSDNHYSGPEMRGRTDLMGVEADERITDIHDFVRRVRGRQGLRPILPPHRLDAYAYPTLPTFLMNEKEEAVEAGRLQFL